MTTPIPTDATDAPNQPPDFTQQTFTFDDRHWRVRGLDTQRSRARMRVNLLVQHRDQIHIDTLDLYTARLRTAFLRQAAAQLQVDPALIQRDLGRVLLELERLQDRMLGDQGAAPEPEVPPMTSAQRDEALELLGDKHLLQRAAEDLDALGLAGEPIGRQVCYLACVSRLLPRPLAVLVQSSSGAGKTTLQDTVLRLMPPESVVRVSALTGRSLYYMGPEALRHKILVMAEEQGMGEAAYALKLLQSEGRLTLATAEKNRHTGRRRTEHYEVQGPVAVLLTTTAEEPDAELAGRCLLLTSDERPAQTAAIHHRQRAAYAAPAAADHQDHAIRRRHHNAQRLLAPRRVVLPWADRLTFRTDALQYRRDHAKYLTLIAASALLHQYQREPTLLSGGQQGILATLQDLETANQLARVVLAPRRAELLPGARRLLEQLHAYAATMATEQGRRRSQIDWTQRDVREALGWSDRTLRRHLARLVALQYAVPRPAGSGPGRLYRLCDDRLPPIDGRGSLKLTGASELGGETEPGSPSPAG